jgi:hypothetical protein
MPLDTEERKRTRRLAETRARKARNTRESRAGNLSATSPNKPSERASRSSSAPTSGRAATRRGEREGNAASSRSSSGGVAGRPRGTGARGNGPASRNPGNPRNASPTRTQGSKRVGGAESSRQTFSQAFAAERKEKGPGKTFTWTNPKTGKTGTYTTDTADDKANDRARSGSMDQKQYAAIMGFERDSGAPNTRTPAAETAAKNAAARRKQAASKMPEKPKRPRGKVGMNSPEMREYRKKLSAYRKAQEASSKKSAGGRVMMKKAAAKKAAAKKAAKKKAARRP